ncbi:D-alanyl-D-alanine carboxypeptidase family protein [Novosphingobium sp. JCM 18896]|uniref:D-alanyl-D-alanine carboxypeptidase family protein n=1 Tax=Novosphingobium sp. JCM 18896 TaxID=2989731 RepID=UPI0022237453|nr:D-alanyl-D-alanine carboxypeptidase family protein [Novosphingobium sp. JCM 18896]MCW1428466.1 D-alanyl-D-alanine carboxypeptidase [Novosphingobium sp. JCM 18896]
MLRRSLAILLVPALIAAPATAELLAPPAELAPIPVALLVDVNSGRTLYSREPDRRFLPASTTKVMTAFVAFEEIAAGRLASDRQFIVSDPTARQWNGRGTSMYLKAGDRVSTDDLLHGIATASANDASIVLAESYAGDVPRWCAMMNRAAAMLGMTGSRFATPNGWPDQGATYVTARDLVTLGEATITRHPQLYRTYFGQKRMTWNGVELISHDPTVGVVRGADGIKTGHTNEAGYNFLGSAERDGRRLVMVVAGAKTEADRASSSRALLEWGFAEWHDRPLFASGKAVAKAAVQAGDAREVPLVTHRAIAATLARGETGPITLTVHYRGPLVAPIAKDAQVAELEIRAGDAPSSRLPLFAGQAVAKAGPLDRLVNGVMGWFS